MSKAVLRASTHASSQIITNAHISFETWAIGGIASILGDQKPDESSHDMVAEVVEASRMLIEVRCLPLLSTGMVRWLTRIERKLDFVRRIKSVVGRP